MLRLWIRRLSQAEARAETKAEKLLLRRLYSPATSLRLEMLLLVMEAKVMVLALTQRVLLRLRGTPPSPPRNPRSPMRRNRTR